MLVRHAHSARDDLLPVLLADRIFLRAGSRSAFVMIVLRVVVLASGAVTTVWAWLEPARADCCAASKRPAAARGALGLDGLDTATNYSRRGSRTGRCRCYVARTLRVGRRSRILDRLAAVGREVFQARSWAAGDVCAPGRGNVERPGGAGWLVGISSERRFRLPRHPGSRKTVVGRPSATGRG